MHIYARAAARGKRIQVNTLCISLSLWAFLVGRLDWKDETCMNLADYCVDLLVQCRRQELCNYHAWCKHRCYFKFSSCRRIWSCRAEVHRSKYSSFCWRFNAMVLWFLYLELFVSPDTTLIIAWLISLNSRCIKLLLVNNLDAYSTARVGHQFWPQVVLGSYLSINVEWEEGNKIALPKNTLGLEFFVLRTYMSHKNLFHSSWQMQTPFAGYYPYCLLQEFLFQVY